ncbi:unnamed protein product [Cercospora beticola]|nr:unnamed protein product [Cercospora beticola]
MDLYDFINHNDLGGGEADPRFPNRRGSSVWGWAGPRGRQIALIGQHTGTAFVEIDRRGKMTYLGRLPANDPLGSSWREIRVLNNLAIIGSEAVGHNIQIFDMNKVAAIDPANPVTFSRSDVESVFDDLPIGRAHNVVIDWDNEYAIAVGAQPRNQTCAAGLEYINLDDPRNPFKPGCASSDGYTHDAQCVTYNGPDRRYRGKNICVAYNEDSITVWDSTDKANSVMLGRLEYPGATYCHQGWWTERNWHQFVLLNDELDEVQGVVADGVPITHIIDLTDLRNPKWTGTFKSTDHRAVDHNLYIEDGVMFQSNYGAGVWVKDVRSIARHPDGSRVSTLAFFDMHPEDDAAGGSLDFVGSWGNVSEASSQHVIKQKLMFVFFLVPIPIWLYRCEHFRAWCLCASCCLRSWSRWWPWLWWQVQVERLNACIAGRYQRGLNCANEIHETLQVRYCPLISVLPSL